jgi:hypothetical protein
VLERIQMVIEPRGTASALPAGNRGCRLLASEMNRRDVFRTARASLLILPALIQAVFRLERVLSERLADSAEDMPWEEQVEIDRREFLRKTRDTLAGRRPPAAQARSGFGGVEAVQRRPLPSSAVCVARPRAA